jgi:hypothetical protein
MSRERFTIIKLMTFSFKELRFLKVVKPWGFCDLALWLCGQIGSGWCGKSTSARALQCTKKRWISLSGSKVMIVLSYWCVFDKFWWRFSNDVNFSDKWTFPWRKLLKIGRSVAEEPIYNLVETNCVFIKRFMRYIHFCDDGFFWFVHT